ncbi:MAG: Spy/CpxP family protein refolding chaperone [Armatimonadota bacterium]|jgi:hypothetical protein
MSRNTLILIGVLVVLGVGSFAATRLAVQGPCSITGVPAAFAALQDYLELTPAQRTAMRATDRRFAEIRPELKSDVIEARDRLLATIQNTESTPEQTLQATRRFCRAQEALQVNTVEYMVALRGHLNKAQKEKLGGFVERGMCALTGGVCPGRGLGRGRGMGMGLGRGRGAGQEPACCDDDNWRGGR